MLIVENASTRWRGGDGLAFKIGLSSRMSRLSEKKDYDNDGIQKFDELLGWSVPPAKSKLVIFLTIHTNEGQQDIFCILFRSTFVFALSFYRYTLLCRY